MNDYINLTCQGFCCCCLDLDDNDNDDDDDK